MKLPVGSRMSHCAGDDVPACAVICFDLRASINADDFGLPVEPHFVQLHVDRTTDFGSRGVEPADRPQKGEVIFHTALSHP